MSILKAVGFDLDGTLFDHRGAAEAGVEKFFRGLGIKSSPRAYEAWFSAEEEQFERWRTGKISFQEQRRERLRTVLPLLGMDPPTLASQLDALFDAYLRAYRDQWRAFPGSLELLSSLRNLGLRVGLLSNGAEEQQRAKLQDTGLAGAFDVICISEVIGVQKPDAKAFRALADGLGVSPSECLFVGDHAEHDVVGARAAGMRGLLVNRYLGHPDGFSEAVHAELSLGS